MAEKVTMNTSLKKGNNLNNIFIRIRNCSCNHYEMIKKLPKSKKLGFKIENTSLDYSYKYQSQNEVITYQEEKTIGKKEYHKWIQKKLNQLNKIEKKVKREKMEKLENKEKLEKIEQKEQMKKLEKSKISQRSRFEENQSNIR